MGSVNEKDSILECKTRKSWETWLARNHAKPSGVWLRMAKKDSGRKSVSHAEALDVALCYGWIDGLRKAADAETFLQRSPSRRDLPFEGH